MPRTATRENRYTTVSIPIDAAKRLRVAAILKNRPIRVVLIEMIGDYCDRAGVPEVESSPDPRQLTIPEEPSK